MFLIGATIFLLLVVFIGGPAIRLISRPLNANFPLAARLVRASLWFVILSMATWPVGISPLLFKLNCSYFTKFQVEPTVDARVTGYLDERLSVSEYVANHMDDLFLNMDVEDLVAGRIAFFEMKKIRNGSTDETLMPYLRYSLMEIGSPKCSSKIVGFADGQGLLVTGAPGKCLGIESVPSPISQYQVRVSGDVNKSDGTTKVFERSTDKVVAMFRSFEFSFYGSGSVCPSVNVEGEAHSPHLELIKLVFMDAKGTVKKAIFR
jgi:hypothetical protein